jgi:hypothetical protein
MASYQTYYRELLSSPTIAAKRETTDAANEMYWPKLEMSAPFCSTELGGAENQKVINVASDASATKRKSITSLLGIVSIQIDTCVDNTPNLWFAARLIVLRQSA